MTQARILDLLAFLHWSDGQAAMTLGVKRSTVRAWWQRGQHVPEPIAEGLEQIAAIVARVREGKPT